MEFNQLAIANSEGADDMLNRVMPKDNVGLVALLKLKSAERMESFKVKDKYLLVSNAHMHWDPEYSDVKLIQAVLFMNELTGIVKGLVEEKNLGNVMVKWNVSPFIPKLYHTRITYCKKYSRTSLGGTPGDRQMRSPYPEFVLTNIICIEKALKRTEIVFVLTVFLLTRFYCKYLSY